MSTVNTQVVVTAQAKGFQQAQQAATKLTKTVRDGTEKISTSKFRKEMHEMEASLQKVAKKQLALNDAMRGMAKGSAELSKAADEMKKLEHQAHATERRISMLVKAFGSGRAAGAQRAQGGFMQGLLGALLPQSMGAILQRGPGMYAQAAGAGIGGMARGVAGGLASTPFHGVAGVSHALGAVPFVGGAVGGMLQEAAQLSQLSLDNAKKRQDMLPFLSGINSRMVMPQRMGTDAMMNAARAVYDQTMADGPQTVHAQQGSSVGQLLHDNVRHGSALHKLLRGAGTVTETNRLETADELDRRAKNAAADERKRLNDINNAKTPSSFMALQSGRFGFSKIEGEQMMAEMVRAGGGRGAELGRLMPAAFAANRAYGVDMQTAGAFLSADRRGGFEFDGSTQFGKDNGAGALAKAISSGLEMGLEGSELTSFVQRIAQGITDWKSTGITIDPKSISRLSVESARMGLGVARGESVAGDVRSYGQRLGKSGPTSGLDFLAAKHLFGYSGGGGVEESWKFRMRAEKGDVAQGGIESLINELISRDMNPAMAKSVAYDALNSAGIKMGANEIDEMFDLVKNKRTTGASTHAQKMTRARIDDDLRRNAEEAEQVRTAGGLVPKGAAMVDGRLKGQAALENQKDVIGSKLIPAVHAFEKAGLNMAQSVSTVLRPAIDKIAHAAEAFSKSALNGAEIMAGGGSAARVITGGQ